MLDLQARMGLAYLFISHDMAVVERISHRVAVMYLGEIVEIGPRPALHGEPRHPYTMGLRNAFPSLRADQDHLVPIEGYPPDLTHPPQGCAFAARCPFAIPRCWEEDPLLRADGDGQPAACNRAHEAPVLRTQAAREFARLAGDVIRSAPGEAR